jgi:hypothetical protein
MALIKCKECGAEISKKAAACPQCGATRTKSRLPRLIVLSVGVFIIIAYFAIGDDTPRVPADRDAREPSPSQVMRENVALDVEWGLDGRAMRVEMTLTNNNEFAVKDVMVRCTTYAESGARLDQLTHTIHEIFGAGSVREYEGTLGMADPQSRTASCRIVHLERA